MPQSSDEFIADPSDHLIAIIDDRADAERARDALIEAGLLDTHLYFGRTGAEAIDSDGTQHGIGGAVARTVAEVMTNKDSLAEYEDATREGRCVIAVRILEDDQKERVVDILEQHQGRTMNYFGQLVVETLKP